MTVEYEIVRYRPEFRTQVLELETHLWSSDVAVNSAYLKWKYEQNPYSDTPLIYVALAEGKVVGMRGMYGALWQIGESGQTLPGLCGADMVVAPEHRRRGLFTKINTVAMNDLARINHGYAFNFSAAPITFHASLRTGWRTVGPFRTVGRPAGEPTTHDRERSREADRHVSAAQEAPRPEALADLVERIGTDGRMRHVRDQGYFAWRFRNPLNAYRFLFWEDARLEGYMVLQKRRHTRGGAIRILDWEATHPQVHEDLLYAAIDRCRSTALLIWSATLGERTARLLQTAGFRRVNETQGVKDYRPGVLVRAVRDEMLDADWAVAGRRLLDMANWDLRGIYS
ncbi:MAG: GNAT family N-acetyltransferase, partial [bacterium]